MNRKTVGKQKRLARGQVRRDVALVGPGLFGVGNGHENDIGAADGFAGADHFKTFGLGHGNGLAPLIKADDDLAAAVLEVERVGVALGAEAQDGQGLVLQMFQVGVFVGINFGGHNRMVNFEW